MTGIYRRGTRPGFMFMEVMAAVFVFGVALVLAVQIMGWVSTEQRSAARRQWAIQEAQNVLERLTVMPFTALTSDRIAALNLGERAGHALPSGRLDVRVDDEDGPPPSRRLVVEIGWKDRAGRDVPPVRLAAWVHHREEPR